MRERLESYAHHSISSSLEGHIIIIGERSRVSTIAHSILPLKLCFKNEISIFFFIKNKFQLKL